MTYTRVVKVPNEGTDTYRVLQTLKAANNEWVCGADFHKMYLPTYAQRISDLRKMGYGIQSARCRDHLLWKHNHRGDIAMYLLTDDEEAPF
jgi:hypothetical protein